MHAVRAGFQSAHLVQVTVPDELSDAQGTAGITRSRLDPEAPEIPLAPPPCYNRPPQRSVPARRSAMTETSRRRLTRRPERKRPRCCRKFPNRFHPNSIRGWALRRRPRPDAIAHRFSPSPGNFTGRRSRNRKERGSVTRSKRELMNGLGIFPKSSRFQSAAAHRAALRKICAAREGFSG